jgi:molybdate transport system substrate-binding protein
LSFWGWLRGKVTKSLAEGYPADMVVVTSEVLDQLRQDSKLSVQSAKPIARVGIGVAIHEHARVPDISSVEAFKKTLLAAKSEVNAKATLGSGGYVTEPVGRGEIELGIHQISEILPVKGVRLAGPLPAELQKYTVYVAVPVAQSARQHVVSDFVKHLTNAQARERLAQAGYTPPE